MGCIQWQHAYATGIESIDAQHLQLVDLINRLAVSVERQDREDMSDILHGLRQYVDNHFAFEEQLIAESGYPYAEAHIRCHRRFVDRLDSFCRRFEAGAYITRELLNFLKRWLVSHIALDDQAYVPAVMSALRVES